MIRELASASRSDWFCDDREFKELSRRPELVAGLLEHAGDGLAIANPRDKCVFVNRVLCQMTGFSAAELLTAPPYPYWPLEEIETIRSVLARFEESDASPAELRFQRKNGERFRVLLRPTLIRDERGRRLASLSTIVDLSVTRQAAAALKASEQRWRSIAENPYDFVIILGPDYKYRFMNHLLPGLRAEDVIGVLSPFDFLAPEDHARVRQLFDETFRTGRPTFYEIHVPQYDRWYSNVVGAIESDGEICELSLLSRDITEVKLNERAQRRSERRLALALASVQDGVVELDPRTGNHVYSARTYELLGFADGDPELSTQVDGLLARVHPEDVSLASRDLQAALDTGAEFNREFRVRARDGSYRWFHARGRIVEDEDDKRFLAFLTDVTQRYEAEEQRRAFAAELQQAQRLETIGTLAGGIAHDFNNLLTPIMGALEFAQLELPKDHSAQSVLEDASSAAERAKCLTQQILTFARRGQVRLDPVDLVRLVREELRLQPASPSVEVVTEFPARVPIVMGDSTQLQQIIANLITNALHAMRGLNGQLLLRVDQVRVESSEPLRGAVPAGDYARLTVSDQGVGMSESVQSRVFEPFFTTKPLGQGTGLGLAVVHGVVARHGGHLRLRSEPGKGTTFEVYLPTSASAAMHSTEPAPSGPLYAGLGGHIGCVDDEAAVLGVMQRALEMANFKVSAATSPLAALEWFRPSAPRIDVLVTDYRMPDLSGLELAQRVRALRPNLPVILVTGHAEGLPTSSPSGIHAVIRKPFRLTELIQCVESCLTAHATAISPAASSHTT